MGFELTKYLKHLWSLNQCPSNEEISSPEKFRLCQIQRQGKNITIEIPSNRGPETLTTNIMNKEDIRRRAVLLCKGLEAWMSNLNKSTSNPSRWKQTKCQLTDVGIPNGTRNEVKCPPNEQSEYWRDFTSNKKLYLWQEAHRTFQTCVDMMSIFIHIYSQYDRSRIERAREEGTSICQHLNSSLETWADKEVAKRIMNDWFLTDPGRGGQNYISMEDGKPLSENLSILLNKMSLLVSGVQCSRVDEENTNYTDICVYIDPKQCEMMGEHQDTGQDNKYQGLIEKVEKKETDERRKEEIRTQTRKFAEIAKKDEESLRAQEEGDGGSFHIYMIIPGIVFPLLGITAMIFLRKRNKSTRIQQHQSNISSRREDFSATPAPRGLISYRTNDKAD
ncbi:hypothetical protein C922_05601 [Plasmodium inui San Antonio 1]|uniref:Uncharacterized protein n=1 Tax=Plasmodium inui San Antonio 1 TaxID=1237626 RepID=W6ZXK6_9APIC|nr:hypothetical protein C922_05601 [Plasmodium inui San Antonio 1]EUD64018.1 hypothetical protein C922_05601 [Plasmodium inui San Antonio 1]